MKILLLSICFISTTVFASERKEHGAGVKDEWHKDKMAGKKKIALAFKTSRSTHLKKRLAYAKAQ